VSGDFVCGPPRVDRQTAFFGDPLIDRLLRTLVTLAMKLSVARERANLLARYLQANHGLTESALEAFKLDSAAAGARGGAGQADR